MTPFSRLLDSLTQTPDGYAVTPGEDWRQGRTLYGGASAALALAACARAAPDLPPLRSAQIAFVGPAAGDLIALPDILRQGRSAVFMGCDLIGEQGIATRAIFCFGAARESAFNRRAEPAPAAPAPEDCPPLLGQGPGPAFSQHFDLRRAADGALLQGRAPRYLLWGRHRDEAARPDAASLLALADAPPPAAMAAFTAPAMISTMTWMLDVLDPEALARPGWRLLQAEAESLREGYSAQAMAAWGEDGAPLLLARQTVAVFA
jgi:acyl-CoA thioesterase